MLALVAQIQLIIIEHIVVQQLAVDTMLRYMR